MSEPDIFSNPERLEQLAGELKAFVSRLNAQISAVTENSRRLGATWQDAEHGKFHRAIETLRAKFDDLGREIRAREPELQEDARLLRAYLRKQVPEGA